MKNRLVLFVALAAAAALALSPMAEAAKKRLAYGGGPTGGTFQYFSNAIAILLSKNIPDLEVSSEGTGGSAENLKRLDAGDVDFGIVHCGYQAAGYRNHDARDDMTTKQIWLLWNRREFRGIR